MSVRTHFKLIGAAGAAALAIGTLAGTAVAAGPSTATVNYTCTTPPPFASATPSAAYSVAAAPATMAAGQPLATTATFTLDAPTTALAMGALHWTSFTGTITTKPSATQAGLKLTLAKTTLGTGPGGTTDAAASGGTLAGTLPGAFTFLLGNLGAVTLNGFNGTTPAGSVTFPTTGSFGQCTNNVTTTPLMDATPAAVTTTVVKDKTTTKVTSAKYVKAKKLTNASAKVASHFGLKATGSVKFFLKKGTHTLKSVTAKVNSKGIAKAALKKGLSKGKYTVTAKYAGNGSLKGSSSKPLVFKVS